MIHIQEAAGSKPACPTRKEEAFGGSDLRSLFVLRLKFMLRDFDVALGKSVSFYKNNNIKSTILDPFQTRFTRGFL